MESALRSLLILAATAGLAGEVAIYAAALAGAVMHYAAAARRGNTPLSLQAFGRHLVPYDLLVSRWTWLDTAIYVLNKAMFGLAFPSVAVMVVGASRIVQSAFEMVFGVGPILSPGALPLAIFLICALMIRDFAAFYIHLMQHRVPLLWEFHKVHHAPESLVPQTGHRLHPLDQFAGMAAEAPLLGLLTGFYAWLTHEDLAGLILLSVGFYTLINIITFSPLRHSHIDLRLGRLERFLLSPAHHRLHHSVERQHWDKNFAAIFPVWDWLFHTLHEPPRAATYALGLPDAKSQDYSTLAGCYFRPFRAIAERTGASGFGHLLRIGPIMNHPAAQSVPAGPDTAVIRTIGYGD
jgi:sterol desaturase/sphingolipid hydroxylase (fatty acid hydroxylase superfamily)